MAIRRMRDISPEDRPREKIERKGVACLSDQELIAAIIGKGTAGRDVMDISREVSGMLSRKNPPTYEKLLNVEGIGQTKACILMACFEVARRYGTPEEEPAVRITAPEDVLAIPEVRDLKTKKQEHFLVLTLNGASEVIRCHIVTKGVLNFSVVHPREIYRAAIKDNAASIICVHNHPSGNLEPSSADIKITNQLKQAGDILEIKLLDHVIITRSGIASMRSLGYASF